jgi:hypothetical protein
MSDLISKKELIQRLFFSEDGKKYPLYNADSFPTTITLKELQKIIKAQPTINISVCNKKSVEQDYQDYLDNRSAEDRESASW